MYYWSRTDDTRARRASEQPADAYRNDVMIAIYKAWRHVKSPTPSMDVYLLKEYFGQILSRSHLKRRSFRLLEEVSDPNNKKKKDKNQCDVWSVPDLKIESRLF